MSVRAKCVPSLTEFLAKKQITTTVHSSYSPKFAPTDFHLAPKLKFVMMGARYQSVSNIQQSVTKYLKTIIQSDFLRAYQNLFERCKLIKFDSVQG